MHPQNKHQRVEIGKRHGKRRANAIVVVSSNRDEVIEYHVQRLKDMTKFCSCEMCCNPRKNGEVTMQELRAESSIDEFVLNSLEGFDRNI